MSSETSNSTGPIGSGEYVVRPGDCIESIAQRHGHFWETIWNDPNNQEVKDARKSPNVLRPDDRLFIPELRINQVDGATEQRHRFKRKGVPSKLRVRVMQLGKPRANVPYRLVLDGTPHEGETDADGWVEAPIPPDAQRGELTVGKDQLDKQVFQLELGQMDPVTEIAGLQKRLKNLGYACEMTGNLDDQTRSAIGAFQKSVDLEDTGEPDQQTRDKLLEVHGS